MLKHKKEPSKFDALAMLFLVLASLYFLSRVVLFMEKKSW